MIRVYVAGPMGHDLEKRARHVEQATGVALELVRAGFAVYLPHLWHHAEVQPGAVDYERWIEQGLVWVRSCDALLRLPGVSPGADRELEAAAKAEVEVFRSLGDLFYAFKEVTE